MKTFWSILFCFAVSFLYSQVNRNDTIRVEHHPQDSLSAKIPKSEPQVVADIEAANGVYVAPVFSPVKAGLYSAVLPGLGQYYNKKYWKIPVVWGAIGAGVGVTLYNNNLYKKYRNAFVAEINGLPHEFSNLGFADLKGALGREQDRFKRYRDYGIAVTTLAYLLNVVDAVVDAHLYEGRKDPDLALTPVVIQNEYLVQRGVPGLSFNFNF